MFWNDEINRIERPTAPIYVLRKEGRIEEAYQIALKLYQQDTADDVKKALAWVLIDLCKKFISEQNLNQAQTHFNQLSNIQFDFEGDYFVEIIQKQIKFLKPKIDIYYSQIQQADELSKNKQEKQALDIIRSIIANNQLSELNHETYGWILYRYIKAQENNLTSVEVRTFLRDYMNLKNERPSMLHSMILNFALSYSKIHLDFNFYKFFILWNPENLRYEDLHVSIKDGKEIPSLISRICKEFANSNSIADLENDIIVKINLNRETIIDFFRESYFWKLLNAQKEKKFADLWNLFNNYNQIYERYGKSKWHSEILKLASRFMKENESWRFLLFFKEWNPNNFMNSDWKEEKGKEDGEIYKPLAIKSIKKYSEIIKNQPNKELSDLSWLICVYDKAVKLYPDDEWLIREKALLYIKQKDFDSATKIYKKLVMELGDRYYVWQEFSECVNSDNQLKAGMLSKALSLEKNEDFLGDIHLELAAILIEEDLFENALFELETYRKHRESKIWKLSPVFEGLYSKIQSANLNITDNRELYNKFIPVAENFAFQDIDWTEFVLVDRWKSENQKERVAFVNNDSSVEFSIGINRLAGLKKIKIGQVCRVRLHKQEVKKEVDSLYSWQPKRIIIEYKYIPLTIEQSDKEDWAIFQDCFAVVDYINKEKNIIHAITFENKEVFFSQIRRELQLGEFISAKFYTKKVKDESRIELQDIRKIDKDKVISKFQNQIAIVDGINEQKQLFHFVINVKQQGIVKYEETELRPQEGDFIKIWFVEKTDKEKKVRIRPLQIEVTDEKNLNLQKDISGILVVKYKGGFDENMRENWENEVWEIGKKNPDFAFINDYYVPKSLLERHNITTNCKVKARVIFSGNRWKVYDIERE